MKGRHSYGPEAAKVMAKLIRDKIKSREVRTIEDVFAIMNVKDLAQISGITKDRLSNLKASWKGLKNVERHGLANALGISPDVFNKLLPPT